MNSLHSQMFRAKQLGQDAVAEQLMIRMEKERRESFIKPRPEDLDGLIPKLPQFCRHVLEKSQSDLKTSDRANPDYDQRSNCINAAFNFHRQPPRWIEFSTTDFLEIIRTEFHQLPLGSAQEFGDLLVVWSRTGGAWDQKLIDVHAMNRNDPFFPYGLVFEHVLVCLSEGLAFHKADPTPQSLYEIDFIDAIVTPAWTNQGFEVTHHRRLLQE